jgi:hypothetical protein
MANDDREDRHIQHEEHNGEISVPLAAFVVETCKACRLAARCFLLTAFQNCLKAPQIVSRPQFSRGNAGVLPARREYQTIPKRRKTVSNQSQKSQF